MTGSYVRVWRDGQWQDVEIEHLTAREFRLMAEVFGEGAGWAWAEFLAKWIREHAPERPGKEGG